MTSLVENPESFDVANFEVQRTRNLFLIAIYIKSKKKGTITKIQILLSLIFH